MADKSLPAESLSKVEKGPAPTERGHSSADVSERRAFLRRAALIGLPVIVATIPSRTLWAQPSRPAGGGDEPSRPAGGGDDDDLYRPGGDGGNDRPKKDHGTAAEPLALTAGCMASVSPATGSGCASRPISLI